MGGHRRRRSDGRLTTVAVVLAVGTVAGMILLRPTGRERPDIHQFGAIKETYDARIESVRIADCPGVDANTDLQCQIFTVRIVSGPDVGRTFTQQGTLTPGAPRLHPGDKIVVGHQENAPEGFEYSYVDRQRKDSLLWLAAIFCLAVLLLGRLRGVASLAGLGASLAVLLVFVVPAILDGRSPVAVSLVGASAIAFLALYLAHGFNPTTTIALLGTLGGLAVTGGLAAAFQGITHLTGFASEEARVLLAFGADVNLAGLMLGGFIIGALGAIDDITITQASAIEELNAANPSLERGRLFRAGMRIGRAHVASTVNTLALAYAGASLPVLLLFVLSNQSLSTVANGEIIATEIFRTLVGSIGLIASVPLTTLLAVRFAGGASPRAGVVDGSDPASRLRVRSDDEIVFPERRRDVFLRALSRPPARRRD